MSDADHRVGAKARALRAEFDAAFALPPPDLAEATDDLLALRLTPAQTCALRLAEVARLERAPRIVPVPTSAPALRGLVAIRGRVLPAYDLRALLGHGPADAPGWLVVPAAAPVALLFEALEAFVRAPIGGSKRSILELSTLCAEIQSTEIQGRGES